MRIGWEKIELEVHGAYGIKIDDRKAYGELLGKHLRYDHFLLFEFLTSSFYLKKI
ncbi:uncharacterized protein MYCFIDRAFT_205076 [Pseudocercospora fijiensis CIRAD86]|uniref:Uncharacterized protein n=1 Tax=Pseudocercospora fijiensis (strain CIRAD86) TaxID=383855 RepID=M2YLB5_PSEFD|nr:uncharacterized protein MYCFIDRAFT_205076 [Pseudocercospora fijiensis CIRAD86]EME78535.1 hypothetical protein MYCFIDRAFT_205076 [Pseudocercospora fijiensis CIRAD86]